MSRNDVAGTVGEAVARAVTLVHVTHVVDDREAAALLHVRVQMARIGRQHHPAASRMDANDLQAVGVTAEAVEHDPRREFIHALVKYHTTGVHTLDHGRHIAPVERGAQARMAHATTRGIRHFTVLEVEPGARKQVAIARMIVVQVRDDHVGGGCGVDVEQPEQLGRRRQQGPLPGRGSLRVEPRVDDVFHAMSANDPHEVVEGHGHIVHVAVDEVVDGALRAVDGVAQGIELIVRYGHGDTLAWRRQGVLQPPSRIRNDSASGTPAP